MLKALAIDIIFLKRLLFLG